MTTHPRGVERLNGSFHKRFRVQGLGFRVQGLGFRVYRGYIGLYRV